MAKFNPISHDNSTSGENAELLECIRNLCEYLMIDDETLSTPINTRALLNLMIAINALDENLQMGGQLPPDWQSTPATPVDVAPVHPVARKWINQTPYCPERFNPPIN